MRLLIPLMLGLAACAPQYVEREITSDQDLPVRKAFFESRPKPLEDAFRASCTAPGDTYKRVSQELVQCRILPAPDLAAFLVLEFDGALEAPTLIMQKKTEPRGEEYLVEMSYYAEVIQKSGSPRRIYFQQRRLDRLVDELLSAAGGRPSPSET
ncbi:MAG: hypothetical protein AAF729_00435 [Pseudomonadota bacterium]